MHLPKLIGLFLVGGASVLACANTTPDDAGADETPVITNATIAADDAGAAPTWTKVYGDLFGRGALGDCSAAGGCHTKKKGGFKCGVSADECYQGLVDAKLIFPANPASSPLIGRRSVLAWFGTGGSMPEGNEVANPTAAAAVKAWVLDGAKKN